MAAQNPFDPQAFATMFQTPDFSKMMEGFKLPGFDMGAMMESQKRNADAMMAAGRAASEGYQAILSRQMEIFQETMKSAQGQMSAMGETDPAKQQEMMRAAFDKAVANMTEVAETARKSAEEAFSILSARMQESVNELTPK